MKYLKYFEQASEYEAYKNGSDYVLPNVSYVEDNDMVYYHPMQESEDYVMVDLGLPSGLKWADRNVGAASSEDSGLYFRWGETRGLKGSELNIPDGGWNDYFDTSDEGTTFNKYANGKLTVLEASEDAATVNMGAEWRMPTQQEFEELINNTTVTYIDLLGNEFNNTDASGMYDGFKGVRLTGKNGNSIFIPMAGYSQGSGLESEYRGGYLHSSSLAYDDWSNHFIYINNYFIMVLGDYYRNNYMNVRGVCN